MLNVNNFYETFTMYVGNNILYLFIPIAILVFFMQLKKEYKKIGGVIGLILVFAIYNPISYKLIQKAGEGSAYYRFLWIVPSWLAIGYLLYEVIKLIENRYIQLLVVCLISMGIIAGNVDSSELALKENVYQIPSEIINIAEQLNILMEIDGVGEARIIADYQVCNTIRQYDARILFPITPIAISSLDSNLSEENINGVISMLCNNRADILTNVVVEILEKEDIKYVIINKNHTISYDYMINLSWEICGESSNYYILKKGNDIHTNYIEQDIGL